MTSAKGILNALVEINIPEDVSKYIFFIKSARWSVTLLIWALIRSGCTRQRGASGNSCRSVYAKLQVDVVLLASFAMYEMNLSLETFRLSARLIFVGFTA